MSEQFDKTASRWAHQGFNDSDYKQLKEQLAEALHELNASRAEVGRLMSHNASLCEMNDWLKAEVERFKTQEVELTIQMSQVMKRGIAWRDLSLEQYGFSRNCYRKIEDKSDLGALLRIQGEATIVNSRFNAMEKNQL